MSVTVDFTINKYRFDTSLSHKLDEFPYAKNLWPLVYILSDSDTKEAYIGETTDAISRMESHIKNPDKSKLTAIHFITSDRFNKSATLDIESNLIKYIAGDGDYKLLNANTGLANHNFYDKAIYNNLFKALWNELRTAGICRHSLEYIDNSDLFKYSPYKTLSSDQRKGLLVMMKSLISGNFRDMIIEGGAGTGKTILAIFLFKLLKTPVQEFSIKAYGDDEDELIKLVEKLKEKYPDPKIALVIPMSSFRSTIKKVFKNIKGLSPDMVIGPSSLVHNRFDIVFVDESHRLRRRVNLGTYYSVFDNVCKKLGLDPMQCSELDWVIMQSDKSVLFYDENQSVKPSDAPGSDFKKLKSASSTKIEYLNGQFRVRGGNSYMHFLDQLLNCKLAPGSLPLRAKSYEFLLFDAIEDMIKEIRSRNEAYGLSRLIAGYSWKWISSKDKEAYDIIIEDQKLRWNSVSVDWVNSANAINEVGCIHTTQGYDLNYAGIIFGKEITYNPEKDEIEILKENYYDINGKNSIRDPQELKRFIINIYKTILMRGIRGTYIYVCDKSLKAYLENYIVKYNRNA